MKASAEHIQSIQMLHPQTSKVGKLQIKLIIITSFLVLFFNLSFSQPHKTDTAAFKKDFEKLLSKYGINGNGYFINVTSVNQKGGQTALIITNNYFGDSIINSTNFQFSITGGELTVSPKKGIWVSPFVATDSMKSNRMFFDPGPGVSAISHGFGITLENKSYTLLGIIKGSACSKNFPIHINMIKDDPEQFYVFGDMQDANKTYLFYKGQVIWFPIPEE